MSSKFIVNFASERTLHSYGAQNTRQVKARIGRVLQIVHKIEVSHMYVNVANSQKINKVVITPKEKIANHNSTREESGDRRVRKLAASVHSSHLANEFLMTREKCIGERFPKNAQSTPDGTAIAPGNATTLSYLLTLPPLAVGVPPAP